MSSSRSLASTRLGRVVMRIGLYGGGVLVGLPLALGHVMTRIERSEVVTSLPPGYERVEVVSDGLALRGWLARGSLDKAAFVVIHGLGDSLESYLEHASHLIRRGHTVMLLDLRGHGESEGSRTTLGGKESRDVHAAMRYLRETGLAAEGVGLMGHSMGAVAALLAAADQPDVRAVIAEAPFDSYRNTVARHARLIYGLPAWVPLIPMSIVAAEWLAGFDSDSVDCVAAAARIRAPLLAIVDGEDERMPEDVVRRIVDAHRGPAELWVAPGVGHVAAILHPDWEEVVLGFLEEHGI